MDLKCWISFSFGLDRMVFVRIGFLSGPHVADRVFGYPLNSIKVYFDYMVCNETSPAEQKFPLNRKIYMLRLYTIPIK